MKRTFENEGDEFREFIAENIEFNVVLRNSDGSVILCDDPPVVADDE